MAKKAASKSKGGRDTVKPSASSKPRNTDPTTPTPPVTSSFSIWHLGIAVLAFAIGILCPPLLSHFQDGLSTSTSNSSSGSNSSRILQTTTTTSAQHSFGHHQEGPKQPKYPCTNERLADYLHDEPVAGFHIVCLELDAQRTLQLNVHVGGTSRRLVHHELKSVTWDAFKETLRNTASLFDTSRPEFQPWAIFSPIGERLFDASVVEAPSSNPDIVGTLAKEYGMVLVYEGGQFLWPGVRLGFKREVSLYSIMPGYTTKTFEKNQTATLETLSLVPLVLSVEGFLTKDECRHIQEVAAPSLEYSGVVLMDKDKGRPASDFRTSQTTFLGPVDDIFVDIDYRTASLTRVPRNHQEHVQVLRYGVGEHYDSHHDYFDPQFYQSDKNTLRLIRNGNRNRLATVFWYLSDVAEGGETVFPRFNRGQERSFRDCETGLLVKPQEGKVIIFYSLTADGKMDSYSLHGACPPKEGIKWAANKWIWNERMGYTPP